MNILTIQELEEACAYWQNRLRLNSWDISIGICRQSDFNNKDAQGEVDYEIAAGTAIIRILDSLDFPDSPFNQDMEVTLVHELLHLHFSAFEPEDGTLASTLMERTIERLAKTLVGLKREVMP